MLKQLQKLSNKELCKKGKQPSKKEFNRQHLEGTRRRETHASFELTKKEATSEKGGKSGKGKDLSISGPKHTEKKAAKTAL